MRFSTLSALALPSFAAARITGIAAPATIAPSKPFSFTLITTGYIQTVADVAVAWGYSLPPAHEYYLGSFTSSSYLGPSKSNILTNVTIETVAPDALSGDAWKGKDIVFSVANTAIYGASGGPVIESWNVTVKVGDETSQDLVASRERGWTENGDCQ